MAIHRSDDGKSARHPFRVGRTRSVFLFNEVTLVLQLISQSSVVETYIAHYLESGSRR